MKEIYNVPLTKIYQKTQEVMQLKTDKVSSPQDALSILGPLIGNTDREHFVVIALNTKYKPVNVEIAHIGALNTSVVHPREIFKGAILSNAAAILIAHNHPSQHLQPSPEDIEVTQRLVDAGILIGIAVIDHLIINNTNEYYSMKEFLHIK